MKTEVVKRTPQNTLDYLSLAITTVGVGYIPGAPGTYGSVVGVAVYIGVTLFFTPLTPVGRGIFVYAPSSAPWGTDALVGAALLILFVALCLIAFWAAGRSIELLGNTDPSQAVIDEVIGQLLTFAFIPFTHIPALIIAGFLLFRLFDIWKPYPINQLQELPGGLGI